MIHQHEWGAGHLYSPKTVISSCGKWDTDYYEAVSEPGKRDATLLDALVRISSSSCGGAASHFLRRADQQLVDGHAPRACHDVDDGIRDILRREELDASPAPLGLLTRFFPAMASAPGRH